jgi:gas vesicle protein
MNGTKCFFYGLSMGVAAGVLMAPRSGVHTRKQIASTARAGREYIEQGGAELKNTVADKLNRTKRAAKQVLMG